MDSEKVILESRIEKLEGEKAELEKVYIRTIGIIDKLLWKHEGKEISASFRKKLEGK
jgi:hypothetical protein